MPVRGQGSDTVMLGGDHPSLLETSAVGTLFHGCYNLRIIDREGARKFRQDKTRRVERRYMHDDVWMGLIW